MLTDRGSVCEHHCPSLFPLYRIHEWMGLEVSAAWVGGRVERPVWLALVHSGGVVWQAEGDPGRLCAPNSIFTKSGAPHAVKCQSPPDLKDSGAALSKLSPTWSEETGNLEMWRWLKFTAFWHFFLTYIFQNPHILFFGLLLCCSTPWVSIMTVN